MLMRNGVVGKITYQSKQKGVALVETILITPLVLFMGLGIIQFGMIYHAKSIVNYATFEAARVGAVSNAQISAMRKELGIRLAPVYGGDGSHKTVAMSMVRSIAAANDRSITEIEVISPSVEAFEDYGVPSEEAGQGVRAIPNSHLRYSDSEIGASGVTLRDANLLKIKVVYGYQLRLPIFGMRVPVAQPVLRYIMTAIDTDHAMYYMRGLVPIVSYATVRMQSEAWENVPPEEPDNELDQGDSNLTLPDTDYEGDLTLADGSGSGSGSGFVSSECQPSGNGLPDDLPIAALNDDSAQCSGDDAQSSAYSGNSNAVDTLLSSNPTSSSYNAQSSSADDC